MKVDTLFVTSSRQGWYYLEDTIAAINWSCDASKTHYVVAVDESETIQQPSQDGVYQLVHTDLPQSLNSGWHMAAGLQWAIENDIEFEQVILLSDDCLPVGQMFDAFMLDRINKQGVGVIGVRDIQRHTEWWRVSQTFLTANNLPTDGWEQEPAALCDGVLVLSKLFVQRLRESGLIVPGNVEDCQLPFGVYLSWACQLSGYFVVGWGSNDKPMPPVYCVDAGPMNVPSPHYLDPAKFFMFAPVSAVQSYTPREVRELFKRYRGEPSMELKMINPTLHGVGQPNTE